VEKNMMIIDKLKQLFAWLFMPPQPDLESANDVGTAAFIKGAGYGAALILLGYLFFKVFW
jgi:hypothetical protein